MNCKQLQSSPDSPEFAELVAERCINGVPYFNWIFLNSPKLNQRALSNILAESLLIIQRRATVAKCKKGTDLGMCYPGSEMPEWFRNQVELPPHSWYNREFLGFALCAVVSFNRGRFDDNCFMTVSYKCHFETNHGKPVELDGSLIIRGYQEDRKTQYIYSDHVLFVEN
ncbi:hypothetical protein ACOSP7_009119 [Xanthoceras sorbifolium]